MTLSAYTHIEIHADRVRDNVHAFREKLPPLTQIMAIIKADASGLGATRLATILGSMVDAVGVVTLSEGVYRMRDTGAKGMRLDNGLSAVLAIGAIRIAVRSHPAMEWDTGMYQSVGLDPAEACLVFVTGKGEVAAAQSTLAALKRQLQVAEAEWLAAEEALEAASV